jgi:hypothetical protein
MYFALQAAAEGIGVVLGPVFLTITAARLRLEFAELVREAGRTAVFITHSIDEALDIGTRIVVLQRPARIAYDVQLGATPAEAERTEVRCRIMGVLTMWAEWIPATVSGRFMFRRLRSFTCMCRVPDPSEGEVLFFSRSLGTNLHVRDAQAESLSSYFRAVRLDLRGPVLTSVPTASYSIDETGETRSPCWTGWASAKLIRRMWACAVGSKVDWPQSMRIVTHKPPVAPQHAPLCRSRQVPDMSKFLACETHGVALTKPFIAEEGAWH